MTASRRGLPRDSGFSFVELLAYMAIAALLILAALPQFGHYRGKAVDNATLSDVRNVATALEGWSMEHPDQPVPFIVSNWESAGSTSNPSKALSDVGVTLSQGTSIWISAGRSSTAPPAASPTASGKALLATRSASTP